MRFHVVLATPSNREFEATIELEETIVGQEGYIDEETRQEIFNRLEVDVRRRCINNFARRGLRVVKLERVL